MKTYSNFVILFVHLIFNHNCFAQHESYYYYNKNKIDLKEINDRIIVKFNNNASLSDCVLSLKTILDIKKINENNKHSNLFLIELEENLSNEKIVNALDLINKKRIIEYANRYYLTDLNNLIGFTNQVIVKLKSTTSSEEFYSLLALQKLIIEKRDKYDERIYTLKVSKNGNALETANSLFETDKFDFSEPNFIQKAKENTNDTYYTSQWALNNTGQNGLADCDMDVQEAWSITTGRNVIKIAIIDKGVQLNHPDLINNLHSGFDASGLGTNGGPIGNSGHGTCCAGIVGAQANNGIGVAGVAHNCSLIPITLDYDNIVNQEVADALNWAWDYGQADVISNSWSGIAQSSIIDAAISNAVSQGRSGLGSVVVWSAGNDSQSPVNYPASNSNVIAVGAMTSSNVRASYSNFGSEIDVVAPGNAIYSTDLTGSSGYNAGDYFDNFDGTSAAAPNVAGVVALILSVNRCLNSTDTRQILELSCDKVGAYCYQPTSGYNNGTWNNEMGYGKVNAYNAVRLASSNLITTVSNVTGSDQGAITCGGNFCSWVLAAGGCSGLAAATYLVNRHNISVNISYSNTPGATIVGFANGFSDSNPNNGNFNMQVSNITSTSATLTTNVYETFTILGQSTGWVPRAPTYVRFWYSVLGHLEESKYLQNENVFGLETHQSLININAGFNVTSAVPNGDYIVQNGANVTFHSGGEVNLEPGFEVLYGGEFFATVNPFFTCAEYPYGKQANISSIYFIDSSAYFNLLDLNKIKSEYIISNHPNPFTSETTIQFEMDRNDIFSLTIFDVFGNEIQNFKSSTSNENKVFKIEFSAANLPNGIYIYSLKTKDFIKTGKMLKL